MSRRLGPDGIVIGGEAFTLARRAAPAVLMLHGAGDTPQTLRYLGEALYANGFHVVAPLLPTHGRAVRDFARANANDLSVFARQELDSLRAEHEWVALVGLSMGGALAAQLAADDDRLPALVLIAPYLAMPSRIRIAARCTWLWGRFAPILQSTDGRSILDPEEQARNLAYGVFTPAALRALYLTMRRAVAALTHVRAPTLYIQSREDNRIAVPDAERAFAKIGAEEKRLEWVTGAAHVITVDYGRDRVIASVVSWLTNHQVSR
jgi:carboxylesterase